MNLQYTKNLIYNWIFYSLSMKNAPIWHGFTAHIIHAKHLPAYTYHPKHTVRSLLVWCNIQHHVLCQAANLTEEDLLHESHVWPTAVCQSIRNQGWQISWVRLHSLEFRRFLQLSFIGAGCKLMQDAGLSEVWSTVYKENSLPEMLKGKACSRACLLTDTALHFTLLSGNDRSQENPEN